jgi:hypothetical protein
VAGRRRAATPAALLWLLLSRPLTTQRTWWLIRRHGIALWLRRLPVTPRNGRDPATPIAPEATR